MLRRAAGEQAELPVCETVDQVQCRLSSAAAQSWSFLLSLTPSSTRTLLTASCQEAFPPMTRQMAQAINAMDGKKKARWPP